jgi:uncharacterized spore protein YtfJ
MTEATTNNTAILETIRDVVDGATAGKVFGSPIVHNGLTVLPVAKVSGGGGGGGGTGPEAHGHETGGSGGGMGLSARPAGVYVIKGDNVSWRPAVDVNRVILGGQLVAVVALLVVRAIIKARSRPGSVA